ncbi:MULTISPECIES: hypothetical protein [Pseudomonas]|uniref:Uncharacterized protein n=1 Tax=Pseudomonas asplenii TaxID=53407 RepID=A0A0M9GDB4_9PSED|nr:hypothetical protein [Pseudomonas fuscovaginae]KPA88271.1 hypothetical protein PF66_05172 [Pseudomonas fuscovaginae]KPA97278.1 hypothetical protein PF70_02632 [Pseudomonas fuscovaginae]
MERTGLFMQRTLDQYVNFITIISERHGWRTLGGVQTNDYYVYRNAMREGCHLQKASFELRHPEEMICDLSNLESIYNGIDSEDIIRLWKYLDSVTKKIRFGGVRRISGDGLSPEIAISGPSMLQLKNIKQRLVGEGFSQLGFDFDKDVHFSKNTLHGIAKNRLLIDANTETMEFYSEFCAFYSKYISHEYWDVSSVFNARYIYEDHLVWHQIKKISKNKLFLLAAGLPLALGYLAATGDQNIFFTEIHRQNDSGLLNRDFAFRGIFPTPNLSSESWLIIDKSYTGGSIKHAANSLRESLGYDADVKTLALFPKSFGAFMSADYAVYAGKLFEVKECAPRLDRECWHTQLIME